MPMQLEGKESHLSLATGGWDRGCKSDLSLSLCPDGGENLTPHYQEGACGLQSQGEEEEGENNESCLLRS